MKTLVTTLMAAATFVAITSAQAEDARGYRHGTVASTHGFQPSAVRHHPFAGLREINLRQEEQRARIEAGLRRGAITRFEYRRLMAEQQDIQARERAFVADGILSPREFTDLNRRLDIASQHIVIEARDRQRRL
jgi:hypothetical protein